jgi:plastocyanin
MLRVGVFVAVLLAVPLGVVGQEATPEAAAPEGSITLAAGGLENPRGFIWGPDGGFFVSLAGNGGTTVTTSTDASPEDQVIGPTMTGQTASVVEIVDGCGVTVADGLPSTADPFGDVQGPVDVGFIGEQMYILQDATGGYEAVGPDFPNGLYALNPNGSVRLVSDLSAYVAANPAGNLYHVLELGEPFAMVAGDDEFWVVDANQGLLLRVATVGTVSVVADLSEGHPVPTAITIAPDGAIYVGYLTPSPHTDGTSKVVRVDPDDGSVTDYWTGLTMVTGLATTADGTLYATEMATGNQTTEPNILPNTGRLVRMTGPSSLDVVVTGMDFPISMGLGPDGFLYVSMPAIATDGELGGIVRVDPALTGPVDMPGGLLASSSCAPATPEAEPEPIAATIEAASPVAAPVVPAGTPGADATPHDLGDKQGIASVAVQIQGYAFTPAETTIPAGAIVAWTNLDTVPHTVTAVDGSFDSGNLGPGETYVHAFETAGTFAYVCSYHPSMQGTITVE